VAEAKNEREAKEKQELKKHRQADQEVKRLISETEKKLATILEPETIRGMNSFQRKQIYRHFEKTQEFRIKSYKDEKEIILRVYPVGNLKRLAEQKMQEVLIKGKVESLPPMGAFERFVIHDYLKEREGVRTESAGEKGKDRHVEIHPIYGRTPKKVRKRLM
jgi:predicted RNA-binding protein Jag